MLDMTFGKKVSVLRKERGWSQADLGNAVGGISGSAISAWERGAIPSLDVALRTARVFGLPLDYLADDSLDELPKPVADPSGLSLEQQMVLKAMEAFGFDETWRRLHPAPDRTAEFQAEIERAYPRDNPPRS